VALRSGALYGLPAASDACLSPVPVVVMLRVVVVVMALPTLARRVVTMMR